MMNKTVGEVLKEFDKNPSKDDPVILIDAVKLIKDMYEDGAFLLEIANKAMEKINVQPIAYDVDNVEKKMKEFRNAIPYDSKDAYFRGVFQGANSCVEILKAGGVNE